MNPETLNQTITPAVSYFRNTFEPYFQIPEYKGTDNRLHYPLKNAPLADIIGAIKNCFYEKQVLLVQQGKYKKQELPCFTPSGTFRIRTDAEIKGYSGIVCLDYDKVPSVFECKEKAKELPYTYAAFFSPSWKGVKVLVAVAGSAMLHKENWKHAKEVYDKHIGIESDTRAGNISRLCYLSFDRDTYLNEMPELLFLPEVSQPKENSGPVVINIDGSRINWLYDFTRQKAGEYAGGNRNNFIYALACNMNRYGVDINEAKAHCETVYNTDTSGFSWAAMLRTVNSAYKNTSEFNTYKFPANV